MRILSFDIEEWFHLLDHSYTENYRNWDNFDCRIHDNMEIIFKLLKKKKIKATFFIVGWIAKKYPEIIKKIDQQGYEIGSHTHMHQLLYNQSRKQVDEDLKRSIFYLNNLIGKEIKCFRAPGFSIREDNKWVFEILVKNGIKIDSSIFPADRAHGGFASFTSSTPSLIYYKDFSIKEFPINKFNILNFSFIFSGGGYFRVSPYNFIKHFTKKSNYVMSYFHPRDFDINQPIIKGLSPLRIFKSYVGLKSTKYKLEKWVDDFKFIDLREANKVVDWKSVPKIYL